VPVPLYVATALVPSEPAMSGSQAVAGAVATAGTVGGGWLAARSILTRDLSAPSWLRSMLENHDHRGYYRHAIRRLKLAPVDADAYADVKVATKWRPDRVPPASMAAVPDVPLRAPLGESA
jgi:hypothetical protein